ncbi:odorant receptor 10-like isoform X2 [Prorops nasuta]|uniref:odorant receptor 10-like isoform X2 n=1 Tax=Prorops nasuta TaxID=863751 RepID=UPI0034CFA455
MNKKELQFSNVSHYKFTRKLLWVLGTSPDQQWSKNKFCLLRVCFVYMLLVFFMYTVITALVRPSDDPDRIITALPLLFAAFFCITKLQNTVGNEIKMNKITEELNRTWKMEWSKDEFAILQEFAYNGKIFGLIYASLFAVHMLAIFLYNRQDYNNTHSALLLYTADYGFNIEKYKYLIYLHQYITSITNMTVFVAIDSLFILFVEHICSLFAVAGHQLEHAFDHYENLSEKYDPDEAYDMQQIIKGLKSQQRAIEFCNIFEDTNSKAYFMTFFVMFLCLTSTLFEASIVCDFSANTLLSPVFLQVFCFFVGNIVHLFFCCYPAQRVIDYSINIHERIYYSYWYKAGLKAQKLLVLALRNTNNPSKITAGGIYVFSLESVAMIVQTSFSYFTMMASMS